MKGNRKNVRNMGSFSGSSRKSSVSSFASRRTGHRQQATGLGLTRRDFLKTTGVVAAGVGAAGLGMSGVTHAQTPQPPVPQGYINWQDALLDGAETTVPADYNAHLGLPDLNSAVTAVKFHTDEVVGVNDSDGSPKYKASYLDGGRLDYPVGIPKTKDGINYTEYTGELSGYGASYFGDKYWYGPEVDLPPEIAEALQEMYGQDELKGVCFILRIPENWNGVLLHNMHGGCYYPYCLYTGAIDDFYALKKGLAYLTMQCGIYESASDTNHNNDEWWTNVAEEAEAINSFGDWGSSNALVPEPMFSRDAVRVMKNICKYQTGKQVEYTYLRGGSYSGVLMEVLSLGRFNYTNLGGNYETPYINSPLHPAYNPNAPMIYDGFINFSTSNYLIWDWGIDFPDPRLPMSKAPIFFYDGSNDAWELSLGGLLFAYVAHISSQQEPGWPDLNDTVFNYTIENLHHYQGELVYAVDKNGSGLYVKIVPPPAPGWPELLDFNYDGDGREVKYDFRKAYEHGIITPYWWTSLPGQILYFNNTSTRTGGFTHQLMENIHNYVSKGVRPPKSRIDPYWSTINPETGQPYTIWPKFRASVPYPDQRDRNTSSVVDLNEVYNGHFAPVLPTVLSVLDYESVTIRLPDDAARLGLYETFEGGMLQNIRQPFTEAELIQGFPLKNWDGTDLVTMHVPNPNIDIPLTGYGTHGGYVNAVSHAVHGLVQQRFWDSYLASRLVEESAQSPYPLVVSKNLGEAKKKLEENPLLCLNMEKDKLPPPPE